MKTGIIIQARMSSTRLPGKVMMKLSNREVLWHVVKRCQMCKMADSVIVATSTDESDDTIASFCEQNNFSYFRGSLEDVLARYRDSAKKFELDIVVRVTSDCPLIEPTILDAEIQKFREGSVDYVSNALNRIFPRGLDCEVFSLKALEKANHEATAAYDREHVTPYIVKNMRVLPFDVDEKYRGDFRLTLDEENDYKLLKLIYEKFYKEGQIVDTSAVIQYLRENPDIAEINKDVAQKASIG